MRHRFGETTQADFESMLHDKLFGQRDGGLRTFTIPNSYLEQNLIYIKTNEPSVNSLFRLVDFLGNSLRSGKVFAKTWVG